MNVLVIDDGNENTKNFRQFIRAISPDAIILGKLDSVKAVF